MDPAYTLVQTPAPPADYCRLREVSGLTPRTLAAAEAGLPRSVIGVHVLHEGCVVGMGRVVGDGALTLTVADVAVEPAHQGRGLGQAIMADLMARLAAQVPAESLEGAYVSLVADLPADRLYARHGFEPVTPRSIGMARWLRRQPSST
jgi:GNAT superfamily N-acetyltransferase